MVFYIYTKKLQKKIERFTRYSKQAILGLFCPIWAKQDFFFQKSHCTILNVLWFSIFMQKNKKRSNGSKDIALRRIERCDWSRDKILISRELEFSQTCGFRRMIEKHNGFHVSPLLAKYNDSILRRSPKTLILGTFGLIWAKRRLERRTGINSHDPSGKQGIQN